MLPGIGAAQAADAFGPRETLYKTAQMLGITSGLQLLIDAGDAASFVSGAQQVNDRSGAGNHLRVGATTGVDASGPADMLWTGVTGRQSKDEYWYPGANLGGLVRSTGGAALPWADSMHGNNASFALAGWTYVVPDASIGGSQMLETMAVANGIGFVFGTGYTAEGANAGKLMWWVANGTGTVAKVFSSGVVPTNQWVYYALIVDEAAGTYSMWVNDVLTTGAITYASPSATTSDDSLWILTTADASTANHRFANMAIWQGGAIPSSAKLGELFQAMRGKFGI